jgi:diguanylate cyclase (GGDEF)-like protein
MEQSPLVAGRPSKQAASPDLTNAATHAGQALGFALAMRADDCWDLCSSRAAQYGWVGRPPDPKYIERSQGINWLATVMTARWIAYRVPVSPEEMLYIADRGDLTASLQQSTVNLTRAYLIWRDTIVEILREEAARLSTPREVLTDALNAVRVSFDASLVQVARAFDRRMAELTGELASERESLLHLSLHDPLTGLPNRVLLYDRINQAVLVSKREGITFAILAIDLDGFKAVNDSLGHESGDIVLEHISDRLLRAVRESDTVARWGGDEFTILLAGATEEAAATVAKTLQRTIRQPVEVSGQTAVVGATIGVATYPRSGSDLQALLSAADRAMYRGKRERGARAAV